MIEISIGLYTGLIGFIGFTCGCLFGLILSIAVDSQEDGKPEINDNKKKDREMKYDY